MGSSLTRQRPELRMKESTERRDGRVRVCGERETERERERQRERERARERGVGTGEGREANTTTFRKQTNVWNRKKKKNRHKQQETIPSDRHITSDATQKRLKTPHIRCTALLKRVPTPSQQPLAQHAGRPGAWRAARRPHPRLHPAHWRGNGWSRRRRRPRRSECSARGQPRGRDAPRRRGGVFRDGAHPLHGFRHRSTCKRL